MKNIISYCLWGDNPKYCVGAIRNSELSKIIYPDWISRFYVHYKVSDSIIYQLKKNNAEVIVVNEPVESWSNMFWRFRPLTDPEVKMFICRDTDSRLNEREKDAVNEWINSDKDVHIMRDHPYHGFAMLGGMIGFKQPIFNMLRTCLDNFDPQDTYGTDYVFFNDILYPNVVKNAMIHDEFFQKNNFPSPRRNFEFVGQVYNENEITIKEHVDALKAHL